MEANISAISAIEAMPSIGKFIVYCGTGKKLLDGINPKNGLCGETKPPYLTELGRHCMLTESAFKVIPDSSTCKKLRPVAATFTEPSAISTAVLNLEIPIGFRTLLILLF